MAQVGEEVVSLLSGPERPQIALQLQAWQPEVRPGLHTNTYDTDVTVLDLPPQAVCNLRLSSPAAMLDSIQVMREKFEKASDGLTSSFGF
jgi:hypothetical protein